MIDNAWADADPGGARADAGGQAGGRCAGGNRSGVRRARRCLGPAPVELQGAFVARDATFGANEPADPSGRIRQEPANLVRRPNTGG
jgi:hypothetical protein